ncbi:hypothetical protein COW36_12390 [bacterium (Candidatus Blackallbacteria) CG17_big_fil_post_rev_8_21_14_2_50_48_46]|uniref:MotA/TolQ/ExbB proton channel domain-containing protein n=1 Tax=bacterium (Candidatus Blackallbacteria) CG17_big_fil_post_rev_8_21_14_2_50_48_46 TaxID=2014261 RepID=A0A2M7G3X3_9BACT|nr:MAG: hypothetical protein COW64_02870 [bacterium (Candidatus Blackallbacteria) CG18_big_fil_WC_8_21_14_2_50_49_26]PIW16559.1 MAG: hypothetical protein COW36_12390 [bacterium (Candidatus Blackallbacteria) CG17_big_fil_post_rev_8_21_14_2_50_48_46]PIW46067.1 MAG: hypothetical protein COW20_17655 [bacterium (Candidatus Blackallbacteria) CG13_big_fil_rev_8_21_14_2_50_49_14]
MSTHFLQKRMPTLLSMFAGLGLLIWAIFSDERLLGLLFQPQALALIVGGTLSATMLGFSWSELIGSLGSFLIAFSGGQDPDLQDVYDTSVYLSQQMREADSPEASQRLLEAMRPRLHHPLLKEGLGLVGGGYTAAMIRETLETTLAQTSIQKGREIRIWKFMGQSAPAFGMGGALLILLQLTQKTAEAAISVEVLGAALVSLLYGVLFSALFFMPIAEQLDAWRARQIHYLQMCLESVILLQHRHHPLYVESVLKPFLSVQGVSPRPKSFQAAPETAQPRKNSFFKQALANEMEEAPLEDSPPAAPTSDTGLSAQQLRQFRPVNRRKDL